MKLAASFVVTCLVLVSSLAAQSPPAEDDILDLKSYSCSHHLGMADLDDGRSDIVTVWAHGYYSGMLGVDETSDTNWMTVEVFSGLLLKVCDRDPEELFITAVKEIARTRTQRSER